MLQDPQPIAPLSGTEPYLRLLIDLTDSCNFKCIQCHFSLPGRDLQKNEFTLDEFRRLADTVLPITKYLGLSCATEPFMHRDFLEVLSIVRPYNVPWVYYITNASMLTERAARETIRAGVDMVTISMDGATKETFERIRHNSNFDKVIANVKRLRDLKRELGSETPRLQFNLTMMRLNIDEVEDWLRLVAELGGQDVDLRHAVPYEGLETEKHTLDQHPELTNRVLDRARALAEELGLHFVNCPPNFSLQEPAAEQAPQDSADQPEEEPHAEPAHPAEESKFEHLELCRMPWDIVQIHPDGGVVPCNHWFTHELMGNVREQPFEEIWNGPKYRKLREQLLTKDYGPNCRVCPAMASGSVDRAESFSTRKI